MAGMWLKAIGYGREEIAQAVFETMRKITFDPWGMTSEHTMRLPAKLASLAPDKQLRVFLVSGGSEANETALRMAKKYNAIRKEPGRYRRGFYHGATPTPRWRPGAAVWRFHGITVLSSRQLSWPAAIQVSVCLLQRAERL